MMIYVITILLMSCSSIILSPAIHQVQSDGQQIADYDEGTETSESITNCMDVSRSSATVNAKTCTCAQSI